jgi:hypothetical protein
MGMMNPIGGMGFNPMMGMQQPFNMGFRWWKIKDKWF